MKTDLMEHLWASKGDKVLLESDNDYNDNDGNILSAICKGSCVSC